MLYEVITYKATNGSMSFLQPFDYVSGIELGEKNRFIVNGEEIRLKDDWMPVGFSPNGSVGAQFIAFAGFGIKAPDLNHDDYANVNVAGGIALVLAGTPDSGNPHSGFGRFSIHAKAILAKEQGAEALVVISNEHRITSYNVCYTKLLRAKHC